MSRSKVPASPILQKWVPKEPKMSARPDRGCRGADETLRTSGPLILPLRDKSAPPAHRR